MADGAEDAQLEALYSRLDAQIKAAQYKKALKSSDDSECQSELRNRPPVMHANFHTSQQGIVFLCSSQAQAQ